MCDSPHHPLLLGHPGVLGGLPGEEAGGAAPLGTADADKVPGPHDVPGRVPGHLVGDHGVGADLLQDLGSGGENGQTAVDAHRRTLLFQLKSTFANESARVSV